MDHRGATIVRYLEFNTWAMLKTLESVEQLSAEELRRDMQTSHSSVWGTLEHTYKADALWLKRLQGDAWPKLDDVAVVDDLAALRKEWSDVHAGFLFWAGGIEPDDWGRVIDYHLLNGTPARSPIYENALHVVNHGTYHRGQVVTMLRQLGAEPIPTDFIRFVRLTVTY